MLLESMSISGKYSLNNQSNLEFNNFTEPRIEHKSKESSYNDNIIHSFKVTTNIVMMSDIDKKVNNSLYSIVIHKTDEPHNSLNSVFSLVQY